MGFHCGHRGTGCHFNLSSLPARRLVFLARKWSNLPQVRKRMCNVMDVDATNNYHLTNLIIITCTSTECINIIVLVWHPAIGHSHCSLRLFTSRRLFKSLSGDKLYEPVNLSHLCLYLLKDIFWAISAVSTRAEYFQLTTAANHHKSDKTTARVCGVTNHKRPILSTCGWGSVAGKGSTTTGEL